MATKKTLRLILGDQLSASISSLKDVDREDDLILMCEVQAEATYVKHHKKKIAFLFSAMRHFANELKEEGFTVRYIKFDGAHGPKSFCDEIIRCQAEYDISEIIVTKPGEYRLLSDMQTWQEKIGIAVTLREDDRFLCPSDEFEAWAKGRKTLRMEYFYRHMRTTHNILMHEGKPIGGQWNFDAENRKSPTEGLSIPPTYKTEYDDITRDILKLVSEHFADHFGDLEPFHFAVTRKQALKALDKFISERLSHFGDYQDAMIEHEPFMYHSHLSFYLNCGLLLPLECVQKAEAAYHTGSAPLNAVEGFIRQIIGWREYVRGIYWLKMPHYAEENFLEADQKLPAFYWSGETQMNCLRQCVLETKQNAYAHHIQRLMVLGNFALLMGAHPDDVNEWFMIVYADAYEWVELPNVTGMILFADGGLLASKPYAAGGSYINKMSNYCKNCSYSPSKKNGPKACPFNYMYWDFLARNAQKLKGNARLGMMYKTYERMSAEKKEAIKADADRFMKEITS